MANTAASLKRELVIRLRKPHFAQLQFLESEAKRKILKTGRRGGKTIVASTLSVQQFLRGRRILYATPTADQLETWWFEVKRALEAPLRIGALRKNENLHVIEVPGSHQRLRGKTAWNADTLRGDYADVLILDEFQLMNEDTWGVVGAPMLLDNNGDAIFIFTPPSVRSRSVTKASDSRHASKMFSKYSDGHNKRWETFFWTTHDNPYISAEALEEITEDMSRLAYLQEIMAEDSEEVSGALWKQVDLDRNRRTEPEGYRRLVVSIDPAGTANQDSDETGICVAGTGNCLCGGSPKDHVFVVEDLSGRYAPSRWAEIAVNAYDTWKADCLVVETNNGGDMVEEVIRNHLYMNNRDPHSVRIKRIHAKRGKATRAEPVVALDEKGMVHHVGEFPELEDQMVNFTGSGSTHDDRVDARVYAVAELSGKMTNPGSSFIGGWV